VLFDHPGWNLLERRNEEDFSMTMYGKLPSVLHRMLPECCPECWFFPRSHLVHLLQLKLRRQL
jgi:hypothetical protein